MDAFDDCRAARSSRACSIVPSTLSSVAAMANCSGRGGKGFCQVGSVEPFWDGSVRTQGFPGTEAS